MKLRARYFDGKTSAAASVDLELFAQGRMVLHQGATIREFELSQLKISARIGNTPRRIYLPEGGVCELSANDALDQWLSHLKAHDLQHRVFRLERYWPQALAAFAIAAVLAWAGIRYGIPALAARAARVVPTSVDTVLGNQTLEILDHGWLSASQLDERRKAELERQFAQLTAGLDATHHYRLELRHGDKIGANALALPSGIVILTDELVALAQDPNEIAAVLAHEIGHVVHRHALRMLLQNSASAVLMMAAFGDVSSVSHLAAVAPAVLVQAKYSRQFETEADDYAYDWLRQHHIATHYFGDLLKRLEKQGGGSKLNFLSSHPQTAERIRD